jgi:hypothetical protein
MDGNRYSRHILARSIVIQTICRHVVMIGIVTNALPGVFPWNRLQKIDKDMFFDILG